MKKFLIFILVLFFPCIVNADEVNYDITNFLVESNILDNGDLHVKELIVLDGNFNGYERDILYANEILEEGESFANNILYNASDITNLTIKAKYVKDVSYETFKDNDFTTFTNTSTAQNGDKGKYITTHLTNGYRYRMYYKSNNNKVAFYLDYIIKDVVVLHNDVAELYWTFIPKGFENDLNNIEIKVYLPNADNTNNFYFWAHGNLNGDITKLNNNSGVLASINSVFPGESVDLRLTFNKELINNLTTIKRSNTEALPKIMEVEKERADIANRLRKNLLFKYNFVKYGTITLYILILTLGIFIYFKYGKSPKSTYYSKYNREFIDDYNVEVIDYLMHKKITPNAMSASIMNLIYKKNIKATEIKNLKSNKKEYEFTLENTDNLNESENILIEFLFDKVGNKEIDNKKAFTTQDLKSYASGTKTCDTFLNSYTKWQNDVLNKGKNENFYEKSPKPPIIGIIITGLGLIISFLAFNNGVNFIPTYFLIFAVIIFLIYTLNVDKKTIKGAEHYAKWQAFKNFLEDFGTFELKELPEIILWERYLVYATIFGIADKIEKSMNVKIKEMDINNLEYDYYPSYIYINIGSSINSSINNAISSAYQSQAANYQNSHSNMSSGGGFGGGFSSGGGFGGGGGGGRGF